MLGFLFQIVLLVIIICFAFTYRKSIRKLLLVSIIISCLLCIASIALDVYKLYLVNQEFSRFKDMNIFVISTMDNISSILIILSLLITITIVVVTLITNKEMKLFSEINIKKANITYGIAFIICIFGIFFSLSQISFNNVGTNTKVEIISDLEIICNQENSEEVEQVKKLLESIETEFSDMNITKWCEEVKSSEFVEFKLLDEDVEVYTFYDSRNIIHKYVDPIVNIRLRESYYDDLYSVGPELGIYDIVELVYFEIENRQIKRNTVIIIHGLTNRDYDIKNNRDFCEQAVYVYVLEEKIEINSFWINIPKENRDYYYIYDFLEN